MVSAQLYGFLSWLWSSIEECLYKENVGVLRKILSKFKENPCFCFGHHSSKLSDSNILVNLTSRRTNLLEISVFKFGPLWTQKIHQSEALFLGSFWFVLV